MRNPPSDQVFAAHGLHHVNLDVPVLRSISPVSVTIPASDAFATAEWLAGTAKLSPVNRYPLLRPLPNSSSTVRFSFCPSADQHSMARFRRQAQLLTLGTFPRAPGPSNRFGRVNEVIAWWEDEHGLWFIVNEESSEGINLVEEWSKIMQDPNMEDVMLSDGPLPVNTEHRARMDQRTGEKVYAAVCELLVKVLNCLKALHEHDLSIISCKPGSFSICRSGDGDFAIVNRLDAVVPLSTFEPSAVLKDSPLASSPLYQRDCIASQDSRLDDHTLRKNLRYLAPETVISKRTSPTGDIYSFGVLVYEMLTGSTIDGGPDSPEEADVDVLIDFHRHVTMNILPPLDWLQREAKIGSLCPALPPRQLSDIVMRCLGKEPDLRYASLDSLSYDLAKLGKICRARGDLEKFKVGEVDELARFVLPPRIICREQQLEALDDALIAVASAPQNRPESNPALSIKIINVVGMSGSGKSRIVRQFVGDAESPNAAFPAVAAWAKLEESIHPPLSSFTQIFTALLDRFLTDPRQDVRAWNEKIRDTLGPRFQLFVSLIPTDYWRMLGVSMDTRGLNEVDWSALRGTFGSWSRQFLQLFATPERPLIIVLDDIQWLPSDESKYWRTLLDGPQSLNHVLLVSTCRVSDPDGNVSSSLLLSPATETIFVPPLSEDGVHKLLLVCFRDRLSSSRSLASFLYAETGGLSLFVRTIVSTLVQEGVIFFDYDALTWRFDVVRLQRHLSKAGVDAYLERLIQSLPAPAQELLFYISCLPRRGFTTHQLARLIGQPVDEVEQLVSNCVASATLLLRNHHGISFAHDGPKAVAYRLIPKNRMARVHSEISQFLRQPEFAETYEYDAADHALQAKKLGWNQDSDEEYVRVLLKGASKTAMAAGFVKATRFLSAVQDTIDSSGGGSAWMKSHRELYLQYIELDCELACVLNTFDPAFAKLNDVASHVDTLRERIMVDSMRVRLMIADGKMHDAVKLTFEVLETHGYHLDRPLNRSILPTTPEEVEVFAAQVSNAPVDKDDIRVLMMSLMASAGSSIYYCEPIKRQFVYDLGLSMALEVKRAHETTAFFVLSHALGMGAENLPLKRAFVEFGRRVMQQCPLSYLLGHILNGVAFQTFFWLPWTELDDDFIAAIEGNINQLNFEQAANAVNMELGSKIFSGRPVSLDSTLKYFDSIRPFVPDSGRYLVKLPLQYQERISNYTPDEPWKLEGVIISQDDTDSIQSLSMHSAFRHTLALRLAVFYDAPVERLEEIVAAGRQSAPAAWGTIYGTEWSFLVAVAAIRGSTRPDDVESSLRDLEQNNISPDFADRVIFLRALQTLRDDASERLEKAEQTVDLLIEHDQNALAGLLLYYIGKVILDVTKSQRLAAGFLRGAAMAYRQAQMFGLCQMLQERWSAISPAAPIARILPSQALGVADHGAPPPLRRNSLSSSGETVISQPSSGSSIPEKVSDRGTESRETIKDPLDALALMRSSLALASEQDPPVLLCTLLRILCQFLRAEYAAIALCDDADNTQVRLRAAGPFSRIVPYDIRLTDEAARHVCPTSLILHTARTGKAVTMLHGINRFRADPFFEDRMPRSLICLPVMMQGQQKGVVILSSMTIATAQGQWEAAKEVLSTLATFATIITSNVSFTKRLKNEVDQRTEELSNALAAKTQFLSQCSHELRSPLSAVLGLAAVLEASSGLSDVQREHLRTIISSGEDLLGLINNILDHSRLESGSVTLESIPFTLRDVVEGALDSVGAVAQKKSLEICLINAADTDPPGLIGDPFRIKQILLNLMSNAVKFTHKGRVTVKWRWKIIEDDKVHVEMDVEDTGIGIPASKMDKLFRSFSQIDESITRSFGGSGLGLIISKDLAKLLGGDCTAQSEFGKGSKFTFSLVADQDMNHSRNIPQLDKPRDCFIICDPGPWWDMLKKNLELLNIAPVRFAEDVHSCLVKGHPEGLNDKKQFDFIMVNTQMVDRGILKRMRELQHAAKMLYLVRSTDLAKTIRDFDITRDAIISRPIKFSSLVRVFISAEKGNSASAPIADKSETSKKVNRYLAKTHPLNILLVDDNAVNVTVGRRILELFGYKNIVSAGDGQQAIDAAEQVQYDLILLDLQMPVLDGFTAQERIRASPLAGDPCIVALTANADMATQQLCADAGFFNYLSKPLDIPRLEKILGEVFEYRKEHRLTTIKPDKGNGEANGNVAVDGHDDRD